MKIYTILLSLLVLLMGYQVYKVDVRTSDLQRQFVEVAAESMKNKEKSRNSNIELQSKCAVQSKKVFIDLGYGGNDHFENHFNEALGKCFVYISSDAFKERSVTQIRFLLDAFENREFGRFMTHKARESNAWTQYSFECAGYLPSGKKISCASEREFDELASQFLER